MGSPLDAGRRIARLIGKADNAPGVIRAYHGSPHSFSRFDASKIGTGEGAQAYGHGLYFAGNEAVAQQYRRQLAGPPEPMDLAIDGVPVFRKAWERLPPLHKDGTNYLYSRLGNYAPEHAEEAMQVIRGDLPRLLQDAESNVDALEKFALERRLSELRGAMDLLDNSRLSVLPPTRPGSTYEVEIGYPEQALLDWDRPIGGALAARLPPDVRRNVELEIGGRRAPQFPGGDPVPLATGETLYRAAGRFDPPATRPGWGSVTNTINDSLTNQVKATERLMEAGIPGIRYLDHGSRAAGEGTRNYVMFPGTEDRISILRQYGLLPPLVGAGMVEEE